MCESLNEWFRQADKNVGYDFAAAAAAGGGRALAYANVTLVRF